MARLSDEKKWSDSWFRALAPELKLGWLYLLDHVDLAGVLDLDRDLAEFQIRCHVDWDRLREESAGRIRRLSNGKLWIPKAAIFQLGCPGVINPKNTFHMGVVRALKKHGLWDVFRELHPSCCVKTGVGPMKALARPSEGPMKAHEGEGEGEVSPSDSKLSQKRSAVVVRGSAAPADPAPPAAPPAGVSPDGFALVRSPKAKAGPRLSRFVLPLRSGAPGPVSQSVIDKAREVYGWSDAEIARIVGKAELWCMTNRRQAPAKSADQFLANWFSREDKNRSRSGSAPSAPGGPAGVTKFGNPVGWKAQLD